MKFKLLSLSLVGCFNFSIYANDIVGEETAIDLNYRYNRTNECSYNRPAYACSGVIIHTQDNDAADWYPSEAGIARGVVSFSWLRNDINTYREGDSLGSIWGDSLVYGIIFDSSEEALLSGKMPAEIYCAYGTNGETKSRENNGCGMNLPNETIPNEDPNDYSSCYPLGVYTSDDLVTKYFINHEGFYGQGVLDQCSFLANKEQFIQAMNTGPLSLPYMRTSTRNNEIIVKEWSSLSAESIPLNAFFYTINYIGNSEISLEKAQNLQSGYFELTGIFKPIISVDMNIIRNGYPEQVIEPFVYNPEDQVVKLKH
ncbi:TPA: hypothetical protein ACX3IN_004920 [Vibrio parahaemolyticus]